MDDRCEEESAGGIWLLPDPKQKSLAPSRDQILNDRYAGITNVCTGAMVLLALVVIILFFPDFYRDMKLGSGLMVFLAFAGIPALFQVPSGISTLRQQQRSKREVCDSGPACIAGVAVYGTTEMVTVYHGVKPSQTLLRSAEGFPSLVKGKGSVDEPGQEAISLWAMSFLRCGSGSIDVTGVAPQALMELLFRLGWFAPGVATQPPEQDQSIPYPARSLPGLNAIMSHPLAPPSPFFQNPDGADVEHLSDDADEDVAEGIDEKEDLFEYRPPAGSSMAMPSNLSVLEQDAPFSPLSVPLTFCFILVGWLVLLGFYYIGVAGPGVAVGSALMGYLPLYLGIYCVLAEGWPYCGGGHRIWFTRAAIGIEADSKTHVFSTKLPLRWKANTKTMEQGDIVAELPQLDIATFQRHATEAGASVEIV